MKTLIGMVLLLAPALQVHAALVFQDCCPDSPWEMAENALATSCCDATAVSTRVEELNKLGAQLYTAGDFPNAEKNLRKALALQETESKPDIGALSSTLFNLAAALRIQSGLPESEALYNRAIATAESVFGPDSPRLGHPLAGLALVYMAQGRMTEGMDAAERAVRVSANASSVRQMALVQNTLATLLMARGDSVRAEALERNVVGELTRASATASQEYVNSLTNLGTSRLRLASYRQAELDLRVAGAAALKVAGPNHPLIATIWNNLAKTRAAQGDWKDAEMLFLRALAAWRTSLGPAHPDVAYGLSNLAALYQSRKKYSEADRLFRQALEIDEASAAGSLKVANDWNHLGALAAVQHHYRDAEGSLSKGLAMADRKVGFEHPDTAGIAVNLALVYGGQAKYAEASSLFARALPVKERVLGPDSAELAGLLRLYASSLKGAHDYAGAAKVELRARRITTHNALLAEAR